MSLLDRLRDWLDTPHFCPECGAAIEVIRADWFDPKSGVNVGLWYWKCPDWHLRIYVQSDGFEVVRHGGERHIWGRGKPRWWQGDEGGAT